jgi:pimeloyl-ACP methyl ester carboxylesterase
MVSTHTIKAYDGRDLQVYDTGDDGGTVVIWHHGTPQTGEPPAPLFAEFGHRGIRCISYDRPGYGGSVPRDDRDVATAAADVAAITDTLDVDKFATIGISSGGPHALACAALMPGRVTRAVTVAAPAPFAADGLDWFAEMADAPAARMRAGALGRAAVEAHLSTAGFASGSFTMSDFNALVKEWRWLGEVSEQALAQGLRGVVDDVLSMVTPWGFGPTDVQVPVLVVHGADDRIVPRTHGEWLAHQLGAELWLRPGDGHVAVLNSCVAALDWLVGSGNGSGGHTGS